MKNLIEDISELSGVSDNTLQKLINVSNYCIGHAVHETYCEQKDTTIIDVGVGELTIRITSEGIHYRFVPSKELEKMLIQTVVTKNSPIITKLENKLQDKIDKAYKEVL